MKGIGIAAVAMLASSTVWAASTVDIQAAFAKAIKKGATAVYHDKCDAHGTSSGGIVFNDNTATAMAKVVGMLAASAVVKDHGDGACTPGLLPGNERVYEVYPDGTVKAN